MQGNLFVVAAATEKDTISTFIVETGLAGLRVDPSLARLGWKTCPVGDLYFEDYKVSQQNLFEVTDFKTILLLMQNWERFLIIAPWIGIMKALYDRSVTQAQNRELLGKRVATFSGIRAILANLRINYELSQHLADRAAWLMTQNSDQLLVEMAMTKVFISEKAQKVARDAVQLHGSNGLLLSQHVERFYRDAMLLTILGGDSEITRSAIAQAIF
nr:acyl-CoA dehydrogenase [Microseira wollei]